MSDSLAAPWYERHKGLLTAVGLMGTLVGIFRADILLRLAAIGNWALAQLLHLGLWLKTPHGVLGWRIAVMAVSTTLLLVEVTWLGVRWFRQRNQTVDAAEEEGDCLAFSLNATDFQEEFEGIQWRGTIGGDGRIPVLASHCPHCQYRIKPAIGRGYVPVTTAFNCLDCKKTYKQLSGTPLEIKDVIARKIEAKWRRGELQGA